MEGSIINHYAVLSDNKIVNIIIATPEFLEEVNMSNVVIIPENIINNVHIGDNYLQGTFIASENRVSIPQNDQIEVSTYE